MTDEKNKKLAKMYYVTASGTKKEIANKIEKIAGIVVYKK